MSSKKRTREFKGTIEGTNIEVRAQVASSGAIVGFSIGSAEMQQTDESKFAVFAELSDGEKSFEAEIPLGALYSKESLKW